MEKHRLQVVFPPCLSLQNPYPCSASVASRRNCSGLGLEKTPPYRKSSRRTRATLGFAPRLHSFFFEQPFEHWAPPFAPSLPCPFHRLRSLRLVLSCEIDPGDLRRDHALLANDGIIFGASELSDVFQSNRRRTKERIQASNR